jgi:hypothetical protein
MGTNSSNRTRITVYRHLTVSRRLDPDRIVSRGEV